MQWTGRRMHAIATHECVNEVCWAYCEHFRLHQQVWMLDEIGKYLFPLVIAKHIDNPFKFWNESHAKPKIQKEY